MKSSKSLLLAPLAFLLAACGGDGGGAQTTGSVASGEINNATNETAEPIQINDLPFSDAATDETSEPAPVS